jgi:hypothetical protein
MTIEAARRLAGTSPMDQSGRAFPEAYAPEDFTLTLRHGGYMHPVWNVEARFPGSLCVHARRTR